MISRSKLFLLLGAFSINAWGAASYDLTGSVDWSTWSVSQGGTDLAISGSVHNFTYAHLDDDNSFTNTALDSANGYPHTELWQELSVGVNATYGDAAASMDTSSMNVSTSTTNYYTNTAGGFLQSGTIAQRNVNDYVLLNSTDLITISAVYSMTGLLSTDVLGDFVNTANTFFDIDAALSDLNGNYITQVNTAYRPDYIVQNGDDLVISDGGLLTLEIDPLGYDVDLGAIQVRAELRAYGYSATNPGTPPPAVPIPAAAWLFGSALLGLWGVKRGKG